MSAGDEGTREERDYLGVVEVPAKAYYGAQTQRAVHNFPISGLSGTLLRSWAIFPPKTQIPFSPLKLSWVRSMAQRGSERAWLVCKA